MSSMARGRRFGMDLTEGSVAKKLLIYATPLLLANFLQQMYNTVDTMVVGQFVGNVGTVGVSTGGDMAALISYIAISFGSAGQVYVAQLSGAKDRESISKAIGSLISMMTIVSVISMLICIIWTRQFLELLNCPTDAMSEATSYMIIVSLGLPAVFIYNSICGAMRGMGESKGPLYFIIVSTVVNIVLDLVLVAWFSLASAGTAIATVVAQYASCIASAWYMYKYKEAFNFDFKPSSFRMYREQCGKLTALGIPMTAKLGLVYASQMYCSAMINSYGLVASATNGVGNKINRLVNVFVSGIDTGAASMIGQCLGAKKPERAKKAVYVAFIFALIFNGAISLASIVMPETIYGWYTSDPETIALGVQFMHIAIIMYLLSAVQGPFGAMITGSGAAMLGFATGIIDSVIMRIGISLFMGEFLGMGVIGYFYGNALARIAPSIIGVVYFASGAWQKRKLLSEHR